MRKVLFSQLGSVALAAITCFGFLLVAGWAATAHCCAGGKKPKFSWEKAKEKQQSCVAVLHVCRTAEITTMKCLMKESRTKELPELQFQIAVRNVTDKVRRYNLNLFMPEGPSDDGVSLSEGNLAKLKPGEEQTLLLPVHVKKRPETITVKVENRWSFTDAPVLLLDKIKYLAGRAWNIFRDSSSETVPLETVSTMRVFCRPIK